jgi:hypothetical protein
MPGSTSDEVAKIIEKTFQALTTAKAAVAPVAGEPGPRILFPNGVELLYFKLAIGKDIDVTIAIAGEKAKYPGGQTSEHSAAVGSDGTSVSI